MDGVYDEKRVASISSTVAEAIDAAAFGVVSWDEVPRAMGEAFPGSLCSLLNHNVAENKLNFQAVHNIDPEYLKSYADHYARLNPWIPLWQAVESGTVLVAEEDCPARLFADTEFYNDWLRPQKDIEAAVGIKIDGGPREVIHLPMHYPLSKAGSYDLAAAEVLRRIRSNLRRSIDLGHLLRKRTEHAMAGAALVERACCAALVIDSDRRLRDANQQAVDMLSTGSVAAVRHGGVCLSNPRADHLFRNGIAALSKGLPMNLGQIPFCIDGRWQVSLAPLPASAAVSGILPLFLTRPMVLVLIRDLDARRRGPGDFSALGLQYGLTRSEIMFCERLAKGDSLAETAGILGIKLETARDRVKSIFHKTGTHRQGQLVAMLSVVFM
ncbi:helix-turn-helix transcriptional regulator [Mesorhizobium neociceri]|uniref:Helix-turn-helix transcriptional regulator n=1 Tax=Mesorhizobium neociceri TaxID=1307853 RepID=A0A838BEZ8_9HYPH|nr:helix-turn-helix transcriptional regulator [Mesorhizobium neociceri]MBA1145138.1 helix-turn-helix transcriptional regulator [Mesorhizobium neociceri]